MTPKEKARKLVDRYYSVDIPLQQAKQCALICIEELLYFADTQSDGNQKRWVRWFNVVKQEIEKL